MLEYKKIANGYNSLHREEQLSKLRIIYNYYEQKKIISKNSLILDVGCGTILSGYIFNCRIIAVDSCEEMIKNSKLRDRKNIIPIVAFAENLPFKDKTFDLVFSVTAVHNFLNIKKALIEIKRVAKSNVALSLMRRSSKFEEIKRNIYSLFNVEKVVIEKVDDIFFLKCD